MADVHLPATLPLAVRGPAAAARAATAATVDEAIDRLDERWPGLRDRLCEPGPVLRPHINVYVDASAPGSTPQLGPGRGVDVIAAISGG